ALECGEVGVPGDADTGGGDGPLSLQVLRRGDDRDPADGALRQQAGGDLQCERGLAGAGGGHRQEVLGGTVAVQLECFGLPGAELGDGAQAARSGYATGSDRAAASEGRWGSRAVKREGVVFTAGSTVPPTGDDPPAGPM